MKTTFGSERVAFDIFDLPKVTSGFKSKILAGFRNHRFRLNPGYQGTTPYAHQIYRRRHKTRRLI
jgi:hypothetical protein